MHLDKKLTAECHQCSVLCSIILISASLLLIECLELFFADSFLKQKNENIKWCFPKCILAYFPEHIMKQTKPRKSVKFMKFRPKDYFMDHRYEKQFRLGDYSPHG